MDTHNAHDLRLHMTNGGWHVPVCDCTWIGRVHHDSNGAIDEWIAHERAATRDDRMRRYVRP